MFVHNNNNRNINKKKELILFFQKGSETASVPVAMQNI